jgi:hypothetical protein
MKYILILVLGFALGIYVDRYQLRLPAAANSASNESGPSAGDRFDEKMRKWRLTPDDIKQDLSHTGEVIRTRTDVVGGKISDERIVAVVKAKYILDRDLTASDIHVIVHEGRVALVGSVSSPDLVGRAVGLAMDTDGVAGVDSKLGVAQP